MKRAAAFVTVAIIAACSSLPDAGDGIVALQIMIPDSDFVYVDSSLTLHATAFNLKGNPVDTTVVWRTPDTAFVMLDSLTGVLTGKAVGSARIQAQAGTLISDPVTWTIRADTTTADTTTTPGGIRRRP